VGVAWNPLREVIGGKQLAPLAHLDEEAVRKRQVVNVRSVRSGIGPAPDWREIHRGEGEAGRGTGEQQQSQGER
jgi:hypothetical protein